MMLYVTTPAFGHPFYNRRGVLRRPHSCADKEIVGNEPYTSITKMLAG